MVSLPSLSTLFGSAPTPLYNHSMEVISLNHHCLFFRFNSKKFLLGVTGTLSEDTASARLRPDYIILPSFPYLATQALFLWHLPALGVLGCQNIVVADLAIKRRIETLLPIFPQLTGSLFKWELFKQHELAQEHLMRIYEEHCSKSIPKAIRTQPKGLAFNDGSDKLNIIVPEVGRSFLILHGGQAVLVDPTECILPMLDYYGIPACALKTVILTSPGSPNVFELLSQPHRITILTTEHIYREIRRQIKAFFLWDDTMLSQRLRGAIMTQQYKPYKHGYFEVSFAENQLQGIEFMDIVFGLKRIRMRPQELEQFPSQLMELKDLQLLIVNNMKDPIKKELQSAPTAYRKRVLFNRATRKYGNKYFRTITDNSDFISIQAHQLARLAPSHLHDLAFLFRQQDPNYRLEHCRLAHGERLNAAERVVYVRQGYIRNEKGELFGAPTRVTAREVMGEGNALLMYEPQRNVYFYQAAQKIGALSLLSGEDLLRKVKDNSFVQSIARHKQDSSLLPWTEQQLTEEQVEVGSEWEVLNGLCQLRTYEAGAEIGRPPSLFLVVKGSLKFRGEEAVAGKSMGIGNLRRFYSTAYEESLEIQAVKDCWAIEISLKDLHLRFFSKFPTRMYELFTKPAIFE